MGYAKYYEDNYEIELDRTRSIDDRAHNWQSEKAYINKFIELPKKRKSDNGSVKMIEERYRTLQNIHDSLQYRINISYSVKDLITEIAKSASHTYRRQMQRTYEAINQAIDNCEIDVSNIRIPEMLELERKQLKQIFIKQLISQLFLYIKNSPDLKPENINSIWTDIKSIIAWFYDDDKLIGGIGQSTMSISDPINFFTSEFVYIMELCPYCYCNTIAELNYCLLCGKVKGVK